MKKSNKVLLIAAFSFLLIITAVHLALSSKYKNGNFTTYTADNLGRKDMDFTGVQHIVLKDLANVNLGVGDTASVGKKSKETQDYTVEQKGNTLYVTGTDFVGHQTRSRTAIWVTVPSGGSVTATNVMMDTEQDETYAQASLNVTLNSSRFNIGQYQKQLTYDSVSVTALDSSAVEINRTSIRSLNLRLSKSSIAESGSSFGTLQLAVDTSSEVSLSAPHLIKAKITAANHD